MGAKSGETPIQVRFQEVQLVIGSISTANRKSCYGGLPFRLEAIFDPLDHRRQQGFLRLEMVKQATLAHSGMGSNGVQGQSGGIVIQFDQFHSRIQYCFPHRFLSFHCLTLHAHVLCVIARTLG
jgi:hypothetical protein